MDVDQGTRRGDDQGQYRRGKGAIAAMEVDRAPEGGLTRDNAEGEEGKAAMEVELAPEGGCPRQYRGRKQGRGEESWREEIRREESRGGRSGV